jgi:DNA integrity scanning protein DisA with diadenylate cyclase activity
MSGLSRALLSNAAPVPGLAPLRAGRRASKSVVKGFAAALRISRSSRAGRKNGVAVVLEQKHTLRHKLFTVYSLP